MISAEEQITKSFATTTLDRARIALRHNWFNNSSKRVVSWCQCFDDQDNTDQIWDANVNATSEGMRNGPDCILARCAGLWRTRLNMRAILCSRICYASIIKKGPLKMELILPSLWRNTYRIYCYEYFYHIFRSSICDAGMHAKSDAGMHAKKLTVRGGVAFHLAKKTVAAKRVVCANVSFAYELVA